LDAVDVLDAAEGVEVVDLATVDDALAVVGAAAVGVLVADVDLAELVAAAPGLLATIGAAVEMLLICMDRLPLMFKKELSNKGIGRVVETFSGRNHCRLDHKAGVLNCELLPLAGPGFSLILQFQSTADVVSPRCPTLATECPHRS